MVKVNIKVIVKVFDADVNILKGVSSRANRVAAGHQPSEEERRRLVHVSGEPGVKCGGSPWLNKCSSRVWYCTMTLFSRTGPGENEQDIESGEHGPNEEPIGLPRGCWASCYTWLGHFTRSGDILSEENGWVNQ